MKYRVSAKYFKKKRIEPIFSSLWGLLLGSLVFAAHESVPWFIAAGVILFMIAITGGSSWLGSKRTIEALKNHSIELKDDVLIITDNAMTSELDLKSIHRVVIDKKKRNVASIFIERVKGKKEKLPPYEDLNGLAENLVAILPAEKVKVRGWFHL